MKIAILVREETMDKCTGKGCLNAFFNRKDSFSNYDESTELIAFTHIGGNIDRKIEKMIDNGVDVVHLSSCIRSKYAGYEDLAKKLNKHFKIVGYTHGSKISKTTSTIFMDKL